MEEQTAPAAAPEAAAPADAPKWTPEIEQEARSFGWKAPDEWKGEVPPGYIDDPQRYLERAENFTPFRKLREKLSEVEKTSQDTLRRIEAATARQIERERAQYQAALDSIKAQKVQAVETGDVDAFKALEAREDAVRKQLQQPEAPKQDAVPRDHIAAIEQWSVGKQWFKADKVKTQAAVVLYDEAQRSGLTDPKAILDYVDREMATQFADLRPKAPAPETVEAGLTFGGGSQASAFEKLPKDAKDAFRRFVERGVFKDTKEDRATYAEDYNAA